MHVIIIGLDPADHAPPDRRLFAYENINGAVAHGLVVGAPASAALDDGAGFAWSILDA